jgi:hypothetical protein
LRFAPYTAVATVGSKHGASDMSIARKQFSSQAVGMGDEDWFYLARDTDTDRVFVYHEWSHRKGQTHEGGNEDIELATFLQRSETHQDRLLQLIGTLCQEGH